MVLLSSPLAQLACLLADGGQGLVTGTVIPATFLGTYGEGESHPKSSPSSKTPKPSVNLDSRPGPVS
jgi:hypothetical protein